MIAKNKSKRLYKKMPTEKKEKFAIKISPIPNEKLTNLNAPDAFLFQKRIIISFEVSFFFVFAFCITR